MLQFVIDMYTVVPKMNQKVTRMQRSLALLSYISKRPPPPPSQILMPIQSPFYYTKRILLPSAAALCALVFYETIQSQNPSDHYELTPQEHQKIMSTSV